MKKISGVGKRHIFKSFFKRMNTPYDLRINNAIDGEEMLHLSLTKKSIYMLLSTLLVCSFILASLLFFFTPIKYYIPGYETNKSRNKIVELQHRLDSLKGYQANYRSVLSDFENIIANDSTRQYDTIRLSTGELALAEILNENEIATSKGKKRTIGKRPADTTKNKKMNDSLIKTTKKAVVEEVKPVPKPKKKKDTIIIYQ